MATAVASCSSPPLCTMPSPLPPQSAQSMSSPLTQQKHTFALAQIKGDVCLVQVPHTSAQGGMSSALMVADVHVFRHEFITQFRYSHRATVHPADMHILEPIEDHCTLYEEEKGTVFLARDVMTRMQKLSMQARRPVPPHAQRSPRYHHRPRYSIPASMSSAHFRS